MKMPLKQLDNGMIHQTTRRIECGLEGSEWVNSEQSGMSARHMGQRFVDSMDGAFENFKPRNEVVLWKI
jgi:hypothetical protein